MSDDFLPTANSQLPFLKMNGTGNDFVIIDLRPFSADVATKHFQALTPEAIRAIAARENAVTKGCDQLIVLEPGHARADVFMHIFNADGGAVSACGNATRCVGALLLEETGKESVRVGTKVDVLSCTKNHKNIAVNMGHPRFENSEIPLAAGVDAAQVPLEYGAFKGGMAVGMGNPHIVFFVDAIDEAEVLKHGPIIEHRIDVFPERVNVNVAQIIDKTHITLRTYERGAGLTLACGTGACATLVAAATRGLTQRAAEIHTLGGVLHVEWKEDNCLYLTGAVEMQGKGEIAL